MTGASRAQPGDRPCVPEESAGTCRVCHLVQTIRTKISHGTEYSRKIIKPNNNRLQQTIYQQRTKPHTTSSEKQCIHIHSSLHLLSTPPLYTSSLHLFRETMYTYPLLSTRWVLHPPPPTRDPSQRPFQKVVIFFSSEWVYCTYEGLHAALYYYILFHTSSYYFILFPTISYYFIMFPTFS